tara:strand:- start:123 stop:257 length:135 start_codon:yes stop_codon:yes gene_type:complete
LQDERRYSDELNCVEREKVKSVGLAKTEGVRRKTARAEDDKPPK